MNKDYLRMAKIVLFRFVLFFFSVFRRRYDRRLRCCGCRHRRHRDFRRRHCYGCCWSCHGCCSGRCSLGYCFLTTSCCGCNFRYCGCCLGRLRKVCSCCRLRKVCSTRSCWGARIQSWSVMSGCRSERCSSCGLTRRWRCWDAWRLLRLKACYWQLVCR